MLATGNSYADVLIWSLLLMGLVIIGLVVAVRVKRRITAVDTEPAEAGGFTLSDLRAMHRSGQMSDEEYEKARGRMVAAAQRSAAGTSTLREQKNPADDESPAAPRLADTYFPDLPAETRKNLFVQVRDATGKLIAMDDPQLNLSSPSVDALTQDQREIARRAEQQGEAGPESEKIEPPEHA